tara:strand:- start:311 stop:520 length:210 start_codon:yes stop_codon:yes gene_type:complete
MSYAKEHKVFENTKLGSPGLEKNMEKRPNIDHLIKRIMVERRKEQKKNSLTTITVFLVIFAAVVYFYYN